MYEKGFRSPHAYTAKFTSLTQHYFNVYCPTATWFLNPFSWAHSTPLARTSRFEPIYYLMNIVSPRIAQIAAKHSFFYNRPLLIGPAFMKSHSVCLVIGTCYCEVFFYAQRRSAGRATTLAYDS